MNIIEPSYEVLDKISYVDAVRKIELCGRTAYKSEGLISAASAIPFIKKLIERGHESVLEHVSLSIKFIVDRGFTHELVRHRLVAYTQESTRYCNYGKLGMTVIKPPWWFDGDEDKQMAISYDEWYDACRACKRAYLGLLEKGASPQQARSVLPNSLKTEIVATANIREWRHILRLRTSSSAHPQMRQIMIPLLDDLTMKYPILFEDIKIHE